MTWDGIIDVLSLCNLFELMNVLCHSPSDLDRLLFIEGRKTCRTIASWMLAHLELRDASGRRLDLHHDVSMPYLALQIEALITFQEILDRKNRTAKAPALREKLKSTFPPDHDIHAHLAMTSKPQTFAWPYMSRGRVTRRDLVVEREGMSQNEHF